MTLSNQLPRKRARTGRRQAARRDTWLTGCRGLGVLTGGRTGLLPREFSGSRTRKVLSTKGTTHSSRKAIMHFRIVAGRGSRGLPVAPA